MQGPTTHAALGVFGCALGASRGSAGDARHGTRPVWLVSESVDWQRALDLPPKVRGLYRKVVNTHLTVDGSAAALQVHTSFLPRGPSAAAWIGGVWGTIGGEVLLVVDQGGREIGAVRKRSPRH